MIRPKIIHGRALIQALLDAGVVRAEDRVGRVVIDASVDAPTKLYVERYGDERLLSVVQTLKGVEIGEADT